MIVGKFEDVRTFYEQALEIRNTDRLFASDEEQKYEAQIDALIWCEISRAWRYLGNSEKARESVNRGEQVLVDANVPAGPAWARVRYQQGHTLWLEGNLTEALAMANEALQRFNAAAAQLQKSKTLLPLTQAQRILDGDSVGFGRVYMLLAGIEATLGKSTEALSHLDKALGIFEQNDIKREIAIVCSNQGDIYLKKSEYDQAQNVFHRARDIAEKIGDVPTGSIVLGNLGVLAVRLGNLLEAETWYQQALILVTQMNEPFYISLLHSYIATALIEQGKLNEAKPLLIQALRISRSKHISPCIGFALVALGHLRLIRALASNVQNHNSPGTQNGHPKKLFKHLLLRARTTLQHALTFDGLEADTVLNGQLLLAKIALLLGELENAHDLATKALEEACSSELVWLQARAEYLLGQTLMITGQKDTAETLFHQALATFADTGMRLEHARASQAYAETLLQTSKDAATREQALRYLQEARQAFEECGAALDLQMVEQVLASMKDGGSEVAAPGARADATFTELGAGGRGQERRGR